MKKFIKKTLIFLILTLSLTLSACAINLNGIKFVGGDNTEIINGIQEKSVLTSNVTISTYNFIGKKVSQGSGVIYKSVGEEYYCITNNHVVYDSIKYTVTDAYGDVWIGEVIACDETCDLAVIKFSMNTKNYFYIPGFVESDPKIGDKLISIGNPNGIVNSVAFGEVESYKSIADIESGKGSGSSVEFKVIKHTAPIDSGSSGGAIFTYEYQICGINFATGRDKNGNYLYSYAVQPTKIVEFLTNNNLL